MPARHSLRVKGMAATLALLAYVLGASIYISAERGKIYDALQEMTQQGRHEKALALTEAALRSTLVDASRAAAAALPGVADDFGRVMDRVGSLFATLPEFDPAYAVPQRALARAYEALLRAPEPAHWVALREALARAGDELEIRQQRLMAERDERSVTYRRQYDAVTVKSLLLAAAGLMVFGSLAGLFFARLAHDIQRLERHARHIVHGTRGITMTSRRRDELGQLIESVNRMAVDLDMREQQMRVDAERRSHQQKMLTVGALAAGVAHEVNNPLTVISGLAEELAGDPAPRNVAEAAQLILAHTQRAALAARQLAEVAAAQSADLDWLDLNAQLRRLLRLTGYDRRYRQLVLELEADPELPALRSSPDAIQQALMLLMTLVCDSLLARGRANSTIALRTRAHAPGAELTLKFDAVLDFARQEVQRCLLLTRAIVEPMRARLAFSQAEGSSQKIILTLPLDAGAPEPAAHV